jgi:nucleoside-diphosphate-sugar epimerase
MPAARCACSKRFAPPVRRAAPIRACSSPAAPTSTAPQPAAGAYAAEDETTPPRPANPYAASKVAAEAYAIAAAAAYGLDGRDARVQPHRPGSGSALRGCLVCLAARAIAAGGNPLLHVGNLDAQRDFLDVRDVVAAYVLLLEGAGDDGESTTSPAAARSR